MPVSSPPGAFSTDTHSTLYRLCAYYVDYTDHSDKLLRLVSDQVLDMWLVVMAGALDWGVSHQGHYDYPESI
jgi:hypothetical protein